MSKRINILSLLSLISIVFAPLLTIYRSYKSHGTGEVLVDKKLLNEIVSSADPDSILKDLYDLK